jgi:hypothetical protein
MILRAEALSPAQKSVIEEILGRQILEAEAVSLRAFEPPLLDQPERQAAVGKLHKFLQETDRPHTNISDEECEAALLEAIRSERPSYAQMP